MITALLLVSRILESIPPDVYMVPDPDLAIRGGGGGGVGSLSENTFSPFGAQFGPKQGGARVPRAPPLDPPLLHTNSLSERI